MVVATSGGGKSMFVKLEILMLYLRFTKARFYVVDPENEYAPLVQELGGEVVNISALRTLIRWTSNTIRQRKYLPMLPRQNLC